AAGGRFGARAQIAGRRRTSRGRLRQALAGRGMSGRRVRAIVRRLLQQFRRDRRTVALVFVAPMVIMSLLGYLIRGGGEHVRMGVVDLDQGPLGALVAQRLIDSGSVDAQAMDERTAQSKLESGEIAGYVVFPSDFTQNAQSAR